MVRRMAWRRKGEFRMHNSTNFMHNKTEGTINREGNEWHYWAKWEGEGRKNSTENERM